MSKTFTEEQVLEVIEGLNVKFTEILDESINELRKEYDVEIDRLCGFIGLKDGEIDRLQKENKVLQYENGELKKENGELKKENGELYEANNQYFRLFMDSQGKVNALTAQKSTGGSAKSSSEKSSNVREAIKSARKKCTTRKQ